MVVSVSLFSQSNLDEFDQKYFVGKDLNLLKGKKLIALPKSEDFQKYGYRDFYTTEEMKSSAVYKSPNGYSASNYSDVANKRFLLVDYKEVNRILGDHILILKDEDDSTVYFLYNSKEPSRFPFKTEDPLIIPQEHYCAKIDVRKDKFTGKTVKYSPLLDPVSFTKDGGYYLSLKTYGSTAVVDGTGVIIILSNGQKIKKNTEIDVEVSDGGGFEYSAFIPLNKNDIALLSKYAVDDFKLYIFENTRKLNGDVYKEYFKCMLK